MLQIGVLDSTSATLAAIPDRLRDALSAMASSIAADLQAKIQEKLAGTVLNAKSGALARSIMSTVEDSAAFICVRIATADVKYAAIQEYGGAIPPHEIVPNKAKALAFAANGKQVFAARVNLPAITMPARSYMRSSLAEMANEIDQRMREAVRESLQ